MKILLGLILTGLFWIPGMTQTSTELFRVKSRHATQAVAVDSLHFYAISNSQIVKYRKSNKDSVASWSGPLKHLNSGIIINGKLYCVNSNYPEKPMASSVEIFDPKTLQHIGSQSFGIYEGSCTWVDWYEGHWYAYFSQYENEGGEPGRGVQYSSLVQFDSEWRRTAGWILPKALVERIRPMNLSGGTFREDGLLYCSPHHDLELYILRIPNIGYELDWVKTIPVPFQGQGIAIDRYQKNVLYGIHRGTREVISIKLE
ncbi:MAG: hypothetical protein SFV55_08315 [Haliscomenobacter sp.]|uniref:hypothetical protein n=1 Tax=Haliscomenobacter sp. TaxID=2717303 RepID=UPI0029B44956|nr:hypothetical protein [Haliscomenobacter sp.]MDX2068417.1 hypothetical protein [Haliscomenobacter sp.]